ncbi:hypothetical protein [Aestuariibacter sp. A3R04]|uniref:hypothetical protein n=1 Tax=Aestuariibacter sp. A3R04 TaxID=2841571 RepID=UPI001C08D064|nr:hypothetical protein [Aestuariibacter sp. A3R04]MBU3021684.1 hypothetical protein [Aestuariibacter sp. A3R04]
MLGKHLVIGFQLAAGVFFAQAIYHLFVGSERVLFNDDLQTGLLFLILSYLQKLWFGRESVSGRAK